MTSVRRVGRAAAAAPPEPARPYSVVYILGSTRSGSTLLARALGACSGFFAAGELRFFWRRAMLDRRRCSCGSLSVTCPVWAEVIARLRHRGIGSAQAAWAAGWMDRAVRNRYVHGIASYVNRRGGTRRGRADLVRYEAMVARLYEAVAEVTGDAVIVDSSKNPADALLGLASATSVRYIHVVRDPRAVVCSWRRPKVEADSPSGVMEPHSAVASSLAWSGVNAAVEYLSWTGALRAVRVRYEHWAEAPAAMMSSLLARLDLGEQGNPIGEDSSLPVAGEHIIAGNPDRHDSGRLQIRPDTRWHDTLGSSDRHVTDVITYPLRRRYGYHR